jgi:hypothetical protein
VGVTFVVVESEQGALPPLLFRGGGTRQLLGQLRAVMTLHAVASGDGGGAGDGSERYEAAARDDPLTRSFTALALSAAASPSPSHRTAAAAADALHPPSPASFRRSRDDLAARIRAAAVPLAYRASAPLPVEVSRCVCATAAAAAVLAHACVFCCDDLGDGMACNVGASSCRAYGRATQARHRVGRVRSDVGRRRQRRQ